VPHCSRGGGGTTKATVFVVEDSEALGLLVQEWLAKKGYHPIVSANGGEALRELHRHHPTLVLLDMDIVSLSGWDLLRQIREASEIPVIVVSNTTGTSNMVKALDMGADDYVVKPFECQLLLARIGAVLRRCPNLQEGHDACFKSNGLEVDFVGHRVVVNGRQASVSPTEFRLLSYLVKNAGRVVGHRELLSNVWSPAHIGSNEYLKLYVRYLRLKLEKDPKNPRCIQTVRGIGYRFELAPAAPSPGLC
jgi:two-component system response regulator RegX3